MTWGCPRCMGWWLVIAGVAIGMVGLHFLLAGRTT